MNKTKTIFLTNLIATFSYLVICTVIMHGFIWSLFTPIVLVIFNIVVGIVVFLGGNKELGKAFFLLGIASLLIGGSFCGLMALNG